MHRLRITEIFHSIQGESTLVGLPTVFVRLTGCPLRCQYCDTAYAFSGGEYQTITEILQQVKSYGAQHVTVTGGEPLAQKDCWPLLTALCDEGYTVSLETSGAMPIQDVDARVIKVMDLKTPDSKESDKNLLQNLLYLNKKDQIKFVICSQADYEWSKNICIKNNLLGNYECLFSASHTELSATQLAEWILADKLAVRMQVQLHKYLWQDAQGK